MKHPVSTTLVLLALFFITQLLGILAVSMVMPVEIDATGNVIVGTPDTAMGPPPQISATGGLLLIVIGIIIGTVLVLLLARFRAVRIWKVWFMLASAIAMTVTFGAFFGSAWYVLGTLFGFALAISKVFYPNPIVHNITEILIYPGIAVLFYDILTLPVMFIVLALISLYDIVAVFKSKHMQSMANFQTQSNMFAGLAVPRKFSLPNFKAAKKTTKKQSKIPKKTSQKSKGQPMAILGGGDVVFPLLFASVVLKELVSSGVAMSAAIGLVSIIALTTTLALALLFMAAQKGKFYPAMPAASAGAIIGWLLILLL